MKKEIRLRFAPSPTGKLHIGGVRTFLFNYLYAKHYNGKLFLRIEDTDIERNIKDFYKEIEHLNKLNLKWDNFFEDNTIYTQSKNLKLYQKIALDLIDKGLAYKCFCTKQELEDSRNLQAKNGIKSPKYNEKCRNFSIEDQEKFSKKSSFTIRIKREKNLDIKFFDLNFSEITVNTNDLDDFVIIKENGHPTYNFACVIDDFLMGITHVFRGQEHIANTPKQIIIQKFLKYPEISYCHFSVIVDKYGKKLSKRNKETKQFLSDYLNEGYLPEAIINFLALLGWFPLQKDSEVFVLDELIKAFDGKNISKSPSFFDDTKLLFFNFSHLQKLNDEEYYNYLKTFSKKFSLLNQEDGGKIAKYYKNELQIAKELDQKLEWLEESNPFLPENIQFLKDNFHIAKLIYEYVLEKDAFSYDELINFLSKEKKILKNKNLFFTIRLLITKTTKGPELKFIFFFFSLDKIKKRIINNFRTFKNDH
ncbi:glutamate--tRNA ligase [symbiont of Argiope bruennichi]|uniref:glutamate--tRNA ligase n=1 Tax=symbiont of Argiope bruennichi TaxID=2810479 RepID=UPI003DA20347